jgi:hypothetical protein
MTAAYCYGGSYHRLTNINGVCRRVDNTGYRAIHIGFRVNLNTRSPR